MNASDTANVPNVISKFKGFVSYSHTANKDLAAALQRDLQKKVCQTLVPLAGNSYF